MTKEEKIDFLISCAEDLEKDHNLEIWGIENLQECADAFRDGAEALRERKTGKWKKILIATVPFTIYGYECPFCEFRTATNNFNFCPNCGAKMEVDE